MQNQDKYIKENEETKAEGEKAAEEAVEEKQEEQEPEKLTLEEYYKAKGVDLTYNPENKGQVKKGEIKAEWIKKEKLTLLETKEDLRNQEKKAEHSIKYTSVKTGLAIDESDFDKVGFGSKPAPKDNRRDEPKPEKRGKKNKPQFSADDFPSL